ncbi:PilZ domain protein [Citrifermentans bemidjiense Bem]|uniref:PilZ domain protein n=1 Tax=Citrifermentans bemidjiense (strain ATCC BAA-1014 / DSM 16622 / JCM 12645 / Bem) TaxID=404380 RepID=B5EIZ7_CITBB|nr:PilZ domain-containing protein [Citrifermentans bemidjiense]ACH39952.1 PilZ domain protein [Citrifermentans bemidjiense Bem]
MNYSRQFYRAPSSHSVELLAGESRHTGCLENISLNGALLRLDAAVSFAAGDNCVLQFQVDEKPLPPLQIACEVVHGCDELLGVKFLESKEDAERRLLFLMKLMSDTPQNGDEYLERIRAYLAEYCGPR